MFSKSILLFVVGVVVSMGAVAAIHDEYASTPVFNVVLTPEHALADEKYLAVLKREVNNPKLKGKELNKVVKNLKVWPML